RNGSLAVNETVQMFYSTDGSTWTSAGANFLTSIAPDANINVPSTAPVSSIAITSQTLSQTVNTAASIYLMWQISPISGSSGSNSQALAIDNVSITAASAASTSSNIILNSSFTHPNNIDYAAYQAASGLTTGNSIEVGQFDIQDGGGSSDADALSTTLTACSFTVANSSNIRALALFDGATNLGEITTVGTSAAFSGLTLAAADNGSKTFSIRATFKSAVADNQQISFTVASATASGSGSSFAASNAGAAATSTTGDNNRIEVATTDIIFDQNVSTVAQNAAMSPSPTIRAVDANVNYDLDNTSNVVLTIGSGSTTFDALATTTASMVAGVATFSNLIFSTAANTNTLTATQGSYTDISSSFNVTASAPEINVKQNVTSLVSGSGSYSAGSIISGNSGTAITFTIENLGSANLTYSSISNSNNTDFTLNTTSTSSPIAASGSTIFTVIFNPTTQGSKTTTITINNNDVDEGTYTFTITGTGTVSSSSDIISNGGYSYTNNIDYSSFQTPNTLTTGNSVGVIGLIIQDGAGTADADNLGTTLTAISFSTGGSTAIRTAALFDGSTNVSEVAVNGATTISFSGLTLGAADGSTKNFELRVTYQASVTDNQQITFAVSSATASTTNSGFATANAGAAASSTTGDVNRIEVTASALSFVAQPANTIVNSGMSNVTISANDGNGNRDLDFTSSIRITSTGTLTSTPVDISASLGLANFASLTHTALGTGLTLKAERTSGLDWDVTSSTFDVTVQVPGLLLLEDNFTASNGVLTSNNWTQIGATNTNPISTGNGNGLSYSNYGSSNIGNAAIMTTSGQDVYRTFTSQNPGAVTSTAYFSALLSLSAVQANGDYFLTLLESSVSGSYRARVYAKQGSTASKIKFGIATSNGIVTYTTTEYNINTTILLAVKHVFTTTTSTSSLYINPSTSSEPASADVSDSTASSVSTGLDAVVIRQGTAGSAATLVIDGIRVATNWGALMGNPQYNVSTNIAAGNYNNINVISGTVTSTGNVIVNGTTTNDGIIDIGANTLTINGAVFGSGTFKGGSTSNLTTTGSTGTLYFDQTTPGTTNVIKNLTLNANSSVTLGNALNITAGSTPGVLFVGASATLTTGGNLTLKSDANGTARVSEVGASGAISGNVTVERYIPGKRAWRALTAPLKGSNTTLYNSWQNAGVSASPFTTGVELWGPGGTGAAGSSNSSTGLAYGPGASIKKYTSTGWANVTNTRTTADYLFTTDTNNAYMVFVTGGYGGGNISSGFVDTTLKATGQLITGPVNFTGIPGDTRHTLLGNPYASPIHPLSILGGATNLFTNVWVWDPALGDFGGYVNYDGRSNVRSYSSSGGSYTNSDVAIQSGQAFFVLADNTGGGSLSLTESMKSSNISNTFRNSNTTMASIFRANFFKQTASDWMPLDGCIAAFYEGANQAADEADGKKMINTGENIGFVRNAVNLSSEHYPLVTAQDILNLKIWNTQQAHYKLKLNTEEFTMVGVEAYLQDLYTGTSQPLNLDGSVQDYEFDVDPTVSASSGNRFRIVFTNTALAVTNPEQGQLSIYPNPATGGKVTVSLPTGTFEGCSYELINVLGQVVRQDIIEKGTTSQVSIPITGLPNSWYALRIRKDNKVVYQGKLIINN
ncbi:MAG: hypothetical protein RIT03_460, partial [Bacteroidota bacterium]